MDKIFIFDMDGTLVEYRRDCSMKLMQSKGYFRWLKPEWNMILAMKTLYDLYPNNVYILTAVFPNTLKYSVEEKEEYLNCMFPYMKNHFIMVDYEKGETKAEKLQKVIGKPIGKNFILIDDYTENLSSWEKAGGTSVKYRNGINNTNGTIHKNVIDCYMQPDKIAQYLSKI